MSNPIPINLAVEDAISEAVLRRILANCGGPWAIGIVYGRGGVGYLRKMTQGFNSAAHGTPFVVLADLDRANCAPQVVSEWLPNGAHQNLILRFAVREVEAWVMSDTDSFGRFLGVGLSTIPSAVETLQDPKQELVRVARRSRNKEIVADLVPRIGSTASVGRNYNARVVQYVQTQWDPSAGRHNCDSLNRAMVALERFAPKWK